MEANVSEINLAIREIVERFAAERNLPVRIPGVPWPTDKEEWIQFNGLGEFALPARKDVVRKNYVFECIVYCKHAMERVDGSFSRPWELASSLATLLEQERVLVKSSCLQFLEPNLIYLDLRSLGSNAQGIQQSSPQLNVHCVLIKFDAQLIQTKVTE